MGWCRMLRHRLRWAAAGVILLALMSSCQSLRGVYHTVEEGQTLYRISRTYGVDEAYLARINQVKDPRQLPVGKRLFIPGATRVLAVSAAPAPAGPVPLPPAPAPVMTGVTAKPQPVAPPREQPRSSAPPPSQTQAVPSPQPQAQPQAQAGRQGKTTPDQPSAAGGGGPAAKGNSASGAPAQTPRKGMFSWPLEGKVVRCFSEGGTNPCKGIEIAAPAGTPVRAVAAGSVIYSGNGIKGYGNLIIIKHEDSYFTIYGYNQTNLVKSGAFVSKGERIALSGVPPSGGAPRLHFEIRQGKQSVDPAFFLP